MTSCTFLRWKPFALILAVNLVTAACARSFTPTNVTPHDHVGVEVPVKPSLEGVDIPSLPEREQRVGKGANTAHLGQLRLENRVVSYSAKTKTVRVRGQGVLKGTKKFAVDLFGIVDNDGVAALLPLNDEDQLKTRGRVFCLAIKDNGFDCSSFFVDIYARSGNETFTEQYTDASTDEEPVAHEEESDEGSEEDGTEGDTVGRPGRYVGYPNRTDELFQMKTPPEWLEKSKEDEHNGKKTPAAPADTTIASNTTQSAKPTVTVDDPKLPAKPANGSKPVVTLPAPPTSAKNSDSSANTSKVSQLGDWLKDKLGRDKTNKPTAPMATATPKPTQADVRKSEPNVAPTAPSSPVSAPVVPSVTPAPTPTPTATARPTPTPKPAPTAEPAAPSEDDKEEPVSTHATDTDDEPASAAPSTTIPAPIATKIQAIGCHGKDPNRDECSEGGNLINAAALKLDSPYYEVVEPQQGRYYGTDLLVAFIERLGKLTTHLMPDSKLVVNDLSAKEGKKLDGHASHQNGLDADISYFVESPGRPLTNIVTNQTLAPFVKKEEQWTAFKKAVATSYVSRIFVGAAVKKAFCQFAQENGEFESERETLRRLRVEDKHDNHWHLRLRCPETENAARCLNEQPPENTQGCTATTAKKTTKKKTKAKKTTGSKTAPVKES